MTCLSAADSLLLALNADAGLVDTVRRHLTACEPCRTRVAAFRRVVCEIAASSGRVRGGDGPCLDEIALVDLADGGGDPEARRIRIAHLVSCGHCRRELASLVELFADRGVAAEMKAVARFDPRRAAGTRRLAAAGMIAAAMVLSVLWPHSEASDDALHRAPTITAAAAPALTSPVGEVASVSVLRWNPVAGADLYRVTLYDAASRVLYEAQVAATNVTLPDSVVVAPGRSYLWKVEVRTGFERWTSSELADFTVRIRP